MNTTEIKTKIQNRLNLLANIEQPRFIHKCICFAITRKCPFECRRCFFCGSRDGESVSITDAKAIIANLSDDLEEIVLTGGEPFVDMRLLYDVFTEIKNRRFSELSRISILTTGFWATDREYVREVVRELIDLGVRMFIMGAFDKWHYEAGLKREYPELLLEVLKNDFKAIELDFRQKKNNEDILKELYSRKLYVRPMANNTAIPSGRGLWALKDDEKGILSTPRFMCRGFIDTKYGYTYYVNFNGELHFCSNFCARPLGNLKNETFDSMVCKAKEDELVQMMHKGDVLAFANRYFNLSNEEVEKQLAIWGTCGFCSRLFIEYLKDEDQPIMHKIYEIDKKKWSN